MKIGTKITTKRRSGEVVRAKVTGEKTGTTGSWLIVQPLGDTGKPFGKTMTIRPSQATKA